MAGPRSEDEPLPPSRYGWSSDEPLVGQVAGLRFRVECGFVWASELIGEVDGVVLDSNG
jgi:hypothetical protein